MSNPESSNPQLTSIITSPHSEKHYMRVKPVGRRVRVLRQGDVLAHSSNALRVLEVGHDHYDPVIYVPAEDIVGALVPVPERTTHCPLKGDASYFTLDGLPEAAPIAWTYSNVLDRASVLAEHIAFYADAVTIEEIGAQG